MSQPDGYTVISGGRDSLGHKWEVGLFRGGLVVDVGPQPVSVTDLGGGLSTARTQLCLNGGERDKFAEAVARAVTPGQVTARAYPCCKCCERERELAGGGPCDPPCHLTPCAGGCDEAVTS